jgi:hypothetical protein
LYADRFSDICPWLAFYHELKLDKNATSYDMSFSVRVPSTTIIIEN